MHKYMTPEETAELLKIDLAAIMNLIETGELRAIRLGNAIRIREADLEQYLDTCAVGGTAAPAAPPEPVGAAEAGTGHDALYAEPLPNGARWCHTRTGTPFRVRGTLAQGAEVWPGKMKYPVTFPAEFNRAMFKHFAGKVVPVGGGFDGPTPGSVGEFIKDKLKLKLHPAVYMVGLLIDEGYAEPAGRGRIRFIPKGRQ